VVAVSLGQPERAVRLHGAADALREASGTPLPPLNFRSYGRVLDALRSELGAVAFDAAWLDGRSMSSDQAIAYALEGVQPA
jgi:hypothetical protein